MNSINRYYLNQEAWDDTTLILTGEEAHHCSRVLRSKEGDTVEVFDGEGSFTQGIIVSLAKDRVEIQSSSEIVTTPPLTPIHLCQAIPKGGNMELIVQKAVELGVASIQPLITENTVARAEQLAKKQQKWQRIALEACKQCGQNYLPTVSAAMTFSDWISSNHCASADVNIVAALHPSSVNMKSLSPLQASSASLLIGPEGDFSDSEYEQILTNGFKAVSLGSIVLRVETATLYCLSVLKHEFS